MTLKFKEISRRLQVFGLSRTESAQIVCQIDMWIEQSGIEWTLKRMKAIKIAYIAYYTKSNREVSSTVWISTRNNIPRGSFRRIFNLKKPAKVLSALMVYSAWISPVITRQQWDKFYNSTQSEKIDKPPLCPSFSTEFVKKVSIPDPNFDDSKYQSKFLNGNRIPRMQDKYRTVKTNALDVAISFNHQYARQYMLKWYNGDIPKWFNRSVINQYSSIQNVMMSLDNEHVGRVSFIQESGHKLRAVANPLPSLQILLNPLKERLMASLRNIPEDYTHNQMDAVSKIQFSLQNGNKLTSVDMSDASNNIPFSIQEKILDVCFLTSQLELFKRVSKGLWKVDGLDSIDSLKFINGQPLGVGPSFASFSLAHHFMMRCAISNVDGSPTAVEDLFLQIVGGEAENAYDYWMVGDDMVTTDRYAEAYLEQLQYYNIPISWDKCIFSTDAAEFCSVIIKENSFVHQYKWKEVSDKNFLEYARMLGPKSMALMRPKQQEVLKVIGKIPDIIGGPVSWNSEGELLDVRIDKYWQLAETIFDKSDYTRSEKKREVSYRLMRDLGILINFRRPHPLQGEIASENSRQREEDVLDIIKIQPVKEVILSTLAIFGDSEDLLLNDLERNQLNYIIASNTNEWESEYLKHMLKKIRSLPDELRIL